MNMKQRIVTVLLGLYPAAWRSEYGPELSDVLLARPLGARIITDVLWNGLRQRVRNAGPSTLAGLAVMLVILTGIGWNIAAPQPYGRDWTGLLQPSSMTLPTIIVKPLASELYVLFLVGCGCWISLRGGETVSPGVAAMRISFIAGVPIMLAGALILFGVMDVVVLGPGDTPTTFHEHGFAYTYYSAERQAPSALAVLVSPLFRLPASWIWGTVGGGLGRWISRT